MKARSLKLFFLGLLISATIVFILLCAYTFTYGGVKPEDFTSLDPPNSHGYILVLSYSDQLTGASANLRSLLCLAKRMGGVRVVEPFIYGSYLGMNVSANWTRELRMTDVFDYGLWKQKTPFKKYGEFVPFQTFMESAPRKVVVVQYCTGLSICRSCGHEDVISKGRIFCELNGFQLAGHECLTYGREKVLTLSSIETQLYSNYSKSEVVLMFDLYGGTENVGPRYGYRLFARDCSRSDTRDLSALAPSKSVLSDADRYIQKYLKGLHYISVMIRMERVFIKTKTPADKRSTVAKSCLDNILRRLTTIKNMTGIQRVFLTLDVGHYGSDIFRDDHRLGTKLVERHIEDFMSTIFERNTTISAWEEEFTSIGRMKSPGYISMLQKAIAARGDVLVLVGSGSYQLSTREMYEKLHLMRMVFQLDKKCL